MYFLAPKLLKISEVYRQLRIIQFDYFLATVEVNCLFDEEICDGSFGVTATYEGWNRVHISQNFSGMVTWSNICSPFSLALQFSHAYNEQVMLFNGKYIFRFWF